MNNNEKRQFLEAITGCAVIYRVELKNPQIAMYWEILKDYDLDQVLGAITRHMKSAKFFPAPVELLEYIPAASANQHIGADEAWAIVIESFDEESTVVMTPQIAEARGIALPIFQSSDEVGARVAFRDAYNRIIKTSPSPKWFVSEGFDKARKADAVANAIQLGRLTAGSDSKYRLEAPKATVAGLIEDASKRDNTIDPMAAISRIRSILDNVSGDDGIARRQAEREKAEENRKNVLDRADAFMRRKSA